MVGDKLIAQCDREGEGGVEEELEEGLRGHIFPESVHTRSHTLRRIYGRLRAAVDKIICLFDLLFNSRGRVLFFVQTPIIQDPRCVRTGFFLRFFLQGTSEYFSSYSSASYVF